jgi:hypothetical protein
MKERAVCYVTMVKVDELTDNIKKKFEPLIKRYLNEISRSFQFFTWKRSNST